MSKIRSPALKIGPSWGKVVTVALACLAIIGSVVGFTVSHTNSLAGHVSLPAHVEASGDLRNHEDRINSIERRADIMNERQQNILRRVEQIQEDQKDGFARLEVIFKENAR